MTRSTAPLSDWTYAEYARLPQDGNHYEVIDGDVCVTPAPGPRHQRTAANLYVALRQHVERHGLGEVLWDVDLLFQPHQFLRPDIVYVPPAGLGGITDRGVESVPGLVIEVLSPHSGTIDRVKKPPRYRDFDVPEYWVVDPASRAIEVYRFSAGRVAPVVHDGTFSWKALPDAPPLELEVAVIFPAP